MSLLEYVCSLFLKRCHVLVLLLVDVTARTATAATVWACDLQQCIQRRQFFTTVVLQSRRRHSTLHSFTGDECFMPIGANISFRSAERSLITHRLRLLT